MRHFSQHSASILVLRLAFNGVISTNPFALLALSNTPGTSSAKLNAPSLPANKNLSSNQFNF